MKPIGTALGLAILVLALRWRRGTCQWWIGEERLALGGVLARERDLVLRAEQLLRGGAAT